MNGKRSGEAEGEQPRKRSRFDKPASGSDSSAQAAGQQPLQNGTAAKPAIPSLSALENAKKALLKRKELAAKMAAAGVRDADLLKHFVCFLLQLTSSLRPACNRAWKCISAYMSLHTPFKHCCRNTRHSEVPITTAQHGTRSISSIAVLLALGKA